MKPEKEWLREVGSRVIVITTWPQEGQMGLKRAKPGRKRERRDLVQEGTSLIFGPARSPAPPALADSQHPFARTHKNRTLVDATGERAPAQE